MSNRATAGGRLARFAHLAGISRKPKADDMPVTQDDLDEVKDEIDDVKDDVEEVEDRVDDVEDDVDEVKDDADAAPPEDKPAEAKAYRAGRLAGVKAERDRCAAIFSAPEAAHNMPLAASLAFESRVTAVEAKSLLKASMAGAPAPAPAAAAPARKTLSDRMSGQKDIRLGQDAAAAPATDLSTPKGVAAFILNAGRGNSAASGRS